MGKKLIQSYVWYDDKCFFVSTSNRKSSAMLGVGNFYAETLVWEFNVISKERGNLIGEYEGYEGTISNHLEICENLYKTGKVGKTSRTWKLGN